MSISDTTLRDMLNYDSLAQAEKLTGKSYKDDESTLAIGMADHFATVQAVNAVLESCDDTTFCNTLERYERIITEEGFKQILRLPFFSDSSTQEEQLFVYWHSDGLLLMFDTFRSDVNGGQIAFNLRMNDPDIWMPRGVGGHNRNGIVIGTIDCREALRLKLRELRAVGSFVCPWVERPWLWLLHHQDVKPKDYDYKAINAERIAMLPQHVQNAITPKE